MFTRQGPLLIVTSYLIKLRIDVIYNIHPKQNTGTTRAFGNKCLVLILSLFLIKCLFLNAG